MDYEKLLEVMGKKNISIQMMYRELGISRTAFYRKCHGKSEFTQSEIQHIVDFLQLDSPVGIFLPKSVVKDTFGQYGRRMGRREGGGQDADGRTF